MRKIWESSALIILLLLLHAGMAVSQTVLNEPYGYLGEGYITRKIAYSHDGKTLAVASTRGVWLYDANTLIKVALLEERLGWVGGIAFSPDGQLLASGAPDGSIKLWSLASRQVIAVLVGHEKTVWSVAFSPDGQLLASGSEDETIKLWLVDQMKEVATLEGHFRYMDSFTFSPDGQILASGNSDGLIRLWDVQTREQIAILRGRAGDVNSVAFSPDGQILASGHDDFVVKLWDMATKELVTVLTGHAEAIYSLAYSPDGQTLASGSNDGAVCLWDMTTMQQTALLEHAGWVASVAFSPDGKTLATASNDHQLQLWDIATKRKKATSILEGHTYRVESIAFSPDGQTLASGSYDDAVRLWDIATRQQIAVLENAKRVRSVLYSPDGKTLAMGVDISREDSRYLGRTIGEAHLWDTRTLELIAVLEHNGLVYSIAFSPDGEILATASRSRNDVDDTNSGEVRFWNMQTYELMATLRHDEIVFSVAFSPDGKMIAAGETGVLRLWNVATQQLIFSVSTGDTAGCMEFSPDGQTLAMGFILSGGPFLWEVPNGENMQRLRVPDKHLYPVQSLSFSPNGKILASKHFWGIGATIRLWDMETTIPLFGMETRETEAILEAPKASVVRFSPDGLTLASGNSGGTILLWDTSSFTNMDPITSMDPEGKMAFAWGEVKKTELLQNYPNPFNPDTWIPYQLTSDSHVTIGIYDVLGRLVCTLDMGQQEAGLYVDRQKAAHWDGKNLHGESIGSGVYFYQFVTDDGPSATRKMLMVK